MKKSDTGIRISSKNKNVTNVTRRNFITSCTACAACLALKQVSFIDTPSAPGRRASNMRIRIIYSLHAPVQAVPDWPNTGFDFRPAMDKINSSLSSHFRNIEFLPVLATGPEVAVKITTQDANENIDGYIVYQMNCWNRVVQDVAKTGQTCPLC